MTDLNKILKSSEQEIPRQNLSAFEAIADTFGCALDIHAPEDCPENELRLTWIVEEYDQPFVLNALSAICAEQNMPTPTLTWEEVDTSIDWQAKVAADFPPLSMGKFYITRNDETAPKDMIPLAIPANQAFGSGEHATTSGCLSLFEDLFINQDTPAPTHILDMGAGSGLLAMAAAKVFPQATNIAADIDETSVRICAENCENNNVAHILCIAGDGFTTPEVQGHSPYNLIFANILMNPLLDMAEELVNTLSEDGIAILSGFMPDQFPAIKEAYEQLGLTEIKHIIKQQDTSAANNIPADWVAVAFWK